VSEDVTRDPLVDRLARFRPTSAGIDRDGMLFAAGRASAPRGRAWKILAAVLAISQTATLAGWLAFPRTESPRVSRPIAIEPQSNMPMPPSTESQPMPGSSDGDWARWRDPDNLPSPSAAADPGPSAPTMSIGAGRRVFFIE
jgi:hypothetical protein